MTTANSPDAVGRLSHITAGLVGIVLRAPRTVLALAIALVGVAAWYAVSHLEYRTQRNDLISSEKECQRRWQRHLDAFGDDDDLVVVVRGNDRASMAAAADRLAERLLQHPELFDRVFQKLDLRNLYSRSLFYLSLDELRTIRERLNGMEPLLGRYGSIGWQTLSLQALLAQATLAQRAKQPSQVDRDLLATLPSILDSAARTLEEPGSYRNPWQVAGTRDRADELREPQHLITPDGRLALVLARPVKSTQSFTPMKHACGVARRIIGEVARDYPDLEFGLTGLPVLETDEMHASEVDSTFASWFALLGVAALYFVVYRGARYPLLTVGTLIVGSIWAIGWATLTVGHLNILTTTFAVMLIGMGDYGVLWVARYDEERRSGRDTQSSLLACARQTGPSIATAAFTTSLAFFATMLADFQAIAELGWIAGCGVLFCALACLTVLPAVILLIEAGSSARPGTVPVEAPQTFLPAASRHPRVILLGGVAVVLTAALFGGRVRYDANLLNLQANGLDSVKWERELIRHAAGATWDAMSLAKSRKEALELKARYEALPTVGRVVDAASLVPDDGEAKRPLVAAIHAKLAGLPADLPEPLASDPAVVRELLLKLANHGSDPLAVRLLDPAAAERLRTFDRRMRLDLLADLRELRAVSVPEPIILTDLPASFRERYMGRNGEYLVRAFAADSLWEYDSLQAFTIAAAVADPEASGKSFRTLEGLRQMKAGFERAGFLALAIITLVLWLDFRRLRFVLLGLFPLVVGAVTTLGVMGLAGVPLNPANLIALPLIVGVGVDNGVHILHDYAERTPGTLYRLGRASGRGIAVAGLTTILGFGTLTLAEHRGLASMGLVLALGVAFCMMAALVLLPAILRLLDSVRLKAPVIRETTGLGVLVRRFIVGHHRVR